MVHTKGFVEIRIIPILSFWWRKIFQCRSFAWTLKGFLKTWYCIVTPIFPTIPSFSLIHFYFKPRFNRQYSTVIYLDHPLTNRWFIMISFVTKINNQYWPQAANGQSRCSKQFATGKCKDLWRNAPSQI